MPTSFFFPDACNAGSSMHYDKPIMMMKIIKPLWLIFQGI
ncbi:hypothetical protein OIU79_004246 [Salix purpurea]|uniref:Uncharacterized protein n=1 Tax=Salix purpurea TaxID=77065 RepID=A0A9Q0U9P6_SALPP|nr:hypothetical protein OIU79_004246 [Salix purpurea]